MWGTTTRGMFILAGAMVVASILLVGYAYWVTRTLTRARFNLSISTEVDAKPVAPTKVVAQKRN